MTSKKTIFLGILAALSAMFLLTGCVPANGTSGEGSGGFSWMTIVMVVALIAIFYFLIIRPQSTRRKEQQKMMEGLQPGDRVITAGGIYGEIESVSEDSVVIKIESGAKMRVTKQALVVKRSPDQ